MKSERDISAGVKTPAVANIASQSSQDAEKLIFFLFVHLLFLAECKICKSSYHYLTRAELQQPFLEFTGENCSRALPHFFFPKFLKINVSEGAALSSGGRLSGPRPPGIFREMVVSHLCPFCGTFIDGAEWPVACGSDLRHRPSPLPLRGCLLFVSLISADARHCCLRLGTWSLAHP